MRTKKMHFEALSKARTGISWSNYPAIYAGFEAKGLLPDEIKPRENIFTYAAWRALNRQVKKGEHGIRICTYIDFDAEEKAEDGSEKTVTRRRPWTTTVFHVSQTEENKENGKD